MTTNTGFKGVDVRQTGTALLLRAFLTTGGAVLSTGTTTVELYELESDGTLKSYDFSSNTFKTTALTTATASMTQQAGNNSTTNTGVWTYALATVSGFTVGSVYLALVRNSTADTLVQCREFQYGSEQGDLVVTASGTTGQGYVQDDIRMLLGTAWLTPGTAGTPDVNVKTVNAVSTSSVTTINANIGTTQAITFDANNYQKVDLQDWLGATAPTAITTAQAATIPTTGTILTAGTGANQLSVSSGVASSNITQVLGVAALGGSGAIHTNVALTGTAAGGTNSTITLATSPITNIYNRAQIAIVSGTGAGQAMNIASNTGTLLTIDSVWAVNPDNTSVYEIYYADGPLTDTNGRVQVQYGTSTGQISATGGIVNGNTVQINGVATSSVTAIAANIGTSQPIYFDAGGYQKVDLVDIAGVAVSSSTAQLGVNVVNISGSAVNPTTAQIGANMVNISGSNINTAAAQIGVNVVNIKGNASAGAPGYVGADWSNINAPSSTVGLSGTTIGTITTVSGNVNGSVASINGVTFPSGFSTLTVANIASGVWNAILSGSTAAGTMVAAIWTWVTGTAGGLATHSDATTIEGQINAMTSSGANTLGTVITAVSAVGIVPPHFTNSTFASDGVFSTAALANAPSGGGGGGSGANTLTITVQDTSNNPLSNINVYLQSNGSTIASGLTVSGTVTLICPNGTYAILALPQGQLYLPNSEAVVVTGNASPPTIHLTPIAITPPSPGEATCWSVTYDPSGTTVETGVAFTYQMTALPAGTTGVIVDSSINSVASNGSGLLTMSNLMPLATYTLIKPSTGSTWSFTAGAVNTTTPINGGIL